MTRFERQLLKEAGWDVRVSIVGLVVFFGCMILLPSDWFWFYFAPLAGFWFRYLWVRNRRDEALLRADLAASGGGSTAGCYASEAGICISDGTHHVLIPRDQPQPLLQLPDVGR